jgi:pyruvate dehydrogenase E2 component (dihydrolipoamide acetyltransferase)
MVEGAPASTGTIAAKGETRIVQPDRAQQTVARRSAEARATVPDLELTAEVEMGACLALAQARGCSITAALARACALALRETPHANAAYRDGHFELYSRVNVGVLVETDEAYAVPTVFDADRKSLSELTDEIERLGARARAGELLPSEITGATFTLSNLGAHGVTSATPIIIPPQAAAAVAGAIRQAPLVQNAAIVAGHVMTMTLACDHRILYGPRAGKFLTRIKTLLEEAAL